MSTQLHHETSSLEHAAAMPCREDCVSRRYVTLTESGIIISKRKSPSKKASSWPFTDGCKVQPSKGIATRSCTVLHSRYTVLSLSYKNSKQTLVCPRSLESAAAEWWKSLRFAAVRSPQPNVSSERLCTVELSTSSAGCDSARSPSLTIRTPSLY